MSDKITVKEVTKAVKAHKGELYASVIGSFDAPFIRVYKSSVLHYLSLLQPDEESIWILKVDADGDGYLSAQY